MGVEIVRTPEIEQRPLFDAVLVHCYWYTQLEGDYSRVKPSLRSHIEDRAVARFYDHGRGAGKIVLTADPSATAMKEELIRKYKVPEDDIIVRTTLLKDGEEKEVVTTDDEIELFLNLARENGWTRLADIAAKVHNTRILPGIGATIPMIYKRKGQDVETQAAEDIVSKSHDVRIRSLVRGLGRSRYEWAFRFYEGVKRMILMINPDYDKLSKPKSVKARNALLFKFPIDTYLGESDIPPSLREMETTDVIK